MKQEFLKTIGNCRVHEYMCDESVSAEKIYNNVIENASPFQKKRGRKKALFGLVSGLVAAAIFCIVFLSGKDVTNYNHVTQFQDKSNGNAAQIQDESNSSGKKEKAAVVFCVYEAKQKEQIIMADYMNVMKKREVKTDKKIILGTYDPLSSSVPGYPVMISNSKKNEADVKFSITASEGQLLLWNQETGDVKELGKNGIFEGDERIFWSPLNNGKLVEETEIQVNLFIKDQLEDTVDIKIVMETDGTYVAKRIK